MGANPNNISLLDDSNGDVNVYYFKDELTAEGGDYKDYTVRLYKDSDMTIFYAEMSGKQLRELGRTYNDYYKKYYLVDMVGTKLLLKISNVVKIYDILKTVTQTAYESFNGYFKRAGDINNPLYDDDAIDGTTFKGGETFEESLEYGMAIGVLDGDLFTEIDTFPVPSIMEEALFIQPRDTVGDYALAEVDVNDDVLVTFKDGTIETGILNGDDELEIGNPIVVYITVDEEGGE